MSASAFVQLCLGFCEIAKVPAPAFQAERDGILAFNASWRDVTFDVIYDPAGSPDHAFVLFQMGPISNSHHPPQQVLLALLQANFLSLRANPPTFSCHAETGDAVLQCSFGLAASTPDTLFRLAEEGVKLALRWRADQFIDSNQHHLA